MTIRDKKAYKELFYSMLENLPNINQWRKVFVIETLILFMSIRGIGGLAAIDIDNHTAFHLEAIQSLNSKEQSLSGWYGKIISDRKDTLTSISKYLVADAWFSKRTFADQIIQSEMHLISRFRDDANLKYINTQQLTGKR
ncbi:hypothetical protein [Marinilabilia salmonicolor]|uniref:hypothetical protein n=1 Tax=Marinilabilia salmonicolor TaxID=989 RepID=UPI00029B06BD|nr:hypothetical protein [Marinilabilia salmonicolor]